MSSEADNSKPLFFSDSEDDQPQASRKDASTSEPERPAAATESKIEADESDDELVVLANKVNPSKPAPKVKRKQPISGQGQTEKHKRARVDKNELARDVLVHVPWYDKYIGEFIATGWLSASSKIVKLANGDPVQFKYKRLRPQPPGLSSKKSKKGPNPMLLPNNLVHFHNKRGFEAGRLLTEEASWLARLLDLGYVRLQGKVVEVPPSYSSGAECVLSIQVYLHRSAFESIEPINLPTPSNTKTKGKGKDSSTEAAKSQKMLFGQAMDESDAQKILSLRKSAINKMMHTLDLRPCQTNATLEAHKRSGELEAHDAMLDHYAGNGKKDKKRQAKAAEKKNVKSEDGEEAEGEEVDSKEVDLIFRRAAANDMSLPEMDPPQGFKLDLRTYQKQALAWMHAMETGSQEGARQIASLHPLYEEYRFPRDPADIDGDEDDITDGAGLDEVQRKERFFYFSPYSGGLSVDYPRASKRCRGGILADEMGLGKTVMMSALLHTARPPVGGSSEDDEDDHQDGENPKRMARQSRFGSKGGAPSNTGRRSATLVVCPMTLMTQWASEIKRCSGSALQVEQFYGADKGDLDQLIQDGVDVVVTSYGTLGSEFSRTNLSGESSDEDDGGLQSIYWHRIILDEAHNIRSRTTQAAKSCFALKAKCRWCLTGTPIVNKLEDLQSLLHFIKMEPWGDFSFFKSFVTEPFHARDPKALDVVAIVLEQVLLRREKSMKDKDGNPLVPLPPRYVVEHKLDLSPDERDIYARVYQFARSAFLGFHNSGTVSKNMIAILAIITRLRQACLHPILTLNNLHRKRDNEGHLSEEDHSLEKLLTRYLSKSGKQDQDTEQRILKQAGMSPSKKGAICIQCGEAAFDRVELSCKHAGCRSCFMGVFEAQSSAGQNTTCPICDESVDPESISKTGEDSKAGVVELDSSDGDDVEENPGAKDFVASTKTNALAAELRKLYQEEENGHAVIFSQFTGFLDMCVMLLSRHYPQPELTHICSIESVLEHEGFRYRRLDGSMTQKQRTKALEEFDNPDRPCLMLISLKAGGVGLNLTRANKVFLLDCWWNAAVENQATDRIHRLGQLRPVTVVRFLIKKSIEERMIALQQRKTAIVNAGLGKDSGEALEENLRCIFGLGAEDKEDDSDV